MNSLFDRVKLTSMAKKFYVTTPIYYVNDVPHIGHAYTTIAADVLARHHRQKGDDVFFLTGTDEHGAKIAEAAARAGKEPEIFVDELAPKFQEVWKKLNINYSEFFRTTNPEHEKMVSEFIQKIYNNGFIEKRSYTGLYCVSCERYYKPEELIDGKCPDHNRECVEQSEENYFFLLSKFQDQLIKKIELGEMVIGPASRKNEILSKLKLGLEDVSISRTNVKWGIPVPFDPDQTIYVWFDALLNYFTATKIYHKEDFWPADLHLMAKDILWFHAVIWPAMLSAYGGADFPLPRQVFAHGFFTINGQKMSKTLGNVIDPNEVVDKFGADAVRYALLREFPFGEDGDISVKKIGERYKNDLGNSLGNLLQRVVAMINKYNVKVDPSKKNLISDTVSMLHQPSINKLIEELRFDTALVNIWRVVDFCNRAINENKPWELAKSDKTKLDELLQIISEYLFRISEAIAPFMPETAEKMKKQLETLQPEPLFPRIES